MSAKIEILIQEYKNGDVEFTFLGDLLGVSEILLSPEETEQLQKFYDDEFDNFYDSL